MNENDSGVKSDKGFIEKVVPPDPKPQWHQSMDAQQKSRWVAFLADKKKMEEGKDEWTTVPKNMMTALGLVVPRISVIVPKIADLQAFELTDGSKGIGTIVDRSGNCMYVESDAPRGAAIFRIGHISTIKAKLYDMADIKHDKGNALAVDLPGNTLVIPRGNENFKFIQYKDGLKTMVGAQSHFMGQVIGAIVDKFGNYIYAYHDNNDFALIIQMNNVFSPECKISLSVQGIDKKTLINPFKGKFGEEAKIVDFPSKRLWN